MTEDGALKLLRREVAKAPSQRQWAADNGVNAGDLSRALTGKKGIGPAIFRALGLQKVVTYKRVKG